MAMFLVALPNPDGSRYLVNPDAIASIFQAPDGFTSVSLANGESLDIRQGSEAEKVIEWIVSKAIVEI